MKPSLITILTAAALLGAFFPSHAPARGPTENPETWTVSPPDLDDSIESTITRPEYSWRLPRERPPAVEEEEAGFFASFFRKISRTLHSLQERIASIARRFIEWLKSLLGNPSPRPRSRHFTGSRLQMLMYVLVAAVLSVLAVILFRALRQSRTSKKAPVRPAAADEVPDLLSGDLTAAELPANDWMELAARMFDEGEIRLSLRAMFLACLAFLGSRERLVLARHKSNRDYVRELRRRSPDIPSVPEAFDENRLLFEKVWYGLHPASSESVSAFRKNHERIIHALAPPSQAGVNGLDEKNR
ncbi:MAG: DUF4129 domain-containing protein [Kiritimatiellia bacterium]